MAKQPYALYAAILDEIRSESLFKTECLLASPQAGRVQIAGTPPRNVINLCANNYLGLSAHPDVIAAAHAGIDARGYGLSSVRFICGTQDIHRELEKKIAAFLGTDDAILFGSCFDANGALFETLLTADDAIFSDKLVHASIIDGVRLSKATRHVFAHSDLVELSRLLASSTARIKLIVTDGVFSMDGDLASLDELCSLADTHGALLAVDDSHATGFIGKTGRGTHEHFGVMGRVDIITTTFGKALGGATGGCIAARQEVVDLLRQRARPYLFSNALMPAVVAATLKVLDIIGSSTARRDLLEDHTRFWRETLLSLGFDIKHGATPIVPVMLYDAVAAQRFSQLLFEEGVLASGFFYPVVPKGEARIRTQLSAALTRDDLREAADIFQRVSTRIKSG